MGQAEHRPLTYFLIRSHQHQGFSRWAQFTQGETEDKVRAQSTSPGIGRPSALEAWTLLTGI